jgi:hypothetical protein
MAMLKLKKPLNWQLLVSKQLGYAVEAIDFSIFNQLASALYNKAWVAERTNAVEKLVSREVTHPVIQPDYQSGRQL